MKSDKGKQKKERLENKMPLQLFFILNFFFIIIIKKKK